jgi:GNAT superfamily N-acetyltransferase
MTRKEGVRPANSAELPRLRDVINAAYGRYLGRMERPPAPMSHDLAPDIDQGRVWVIGEQAAGLITLISDGDCILIENVAVHPEAQGRGLGRILMAFADDRARELGISTLRLYTNEAMVENLEIYAHFGYREVDRRTEDGFRRVFLEKTL